MRTKPPINITSITFEMEVPRDGQFKIPPEIINLLPTGEIIHIVIESSIGQSILEADRLLPIDLQNATWERPLAPGEQIVVEVSAAGTV